MTLPINTTWTKCYEDSWKDVIVPEAFSHPAKMARGLLSRILSHAKEQGWIKKGEVLIDCFGGVGTTGILGAYEGYQVVCVELERKFVDLAEQNFKLHDNAWRKLGLPRPIMIQGDSRRLVEVVREADCIVSSPPFHQSIGGGGNQLNQLHSIRYPAQKNEYLGTRKGGAKDFDYGSTPGQLGTMKAGDLIISSPPYTGEALGHAGEGSPVDKKKRLHSRMAGNKYGQTEGNISNLPTGDLIISSPPYEKSMDSIEDSVARAARTSGFEQGQKNLRYGQNPNTFLSKDPSGLSNEERHKIAAQNPQLGQQQGETFWSAAKIIVEQCHQILKPGGHAIWVCKDFVRNKKRVPFSADWVRLCESVGFKLIHWHKATLVKESKHKTLFGHTETRRKERKSFFRRLAESKGSPRIDEEDILCMYRAI